MSVRREKALQLAALRLILENSRDWPVKHFGNLMNGFGRLATKQGAYLTKYSRIYYFSRNKDSIFNP